VDAGISEEHPVPIFWVEDTFSLNMWAAGFSKTCLSSENDVTSQ
jgi:hypothetical protein